MSEEKGLKEKITNIKGVKEATELYNKQTPKRKKLIVGGIVGFFVVIAVVVAASMGSKSSYKEIFPGMEKSEAIEVSAALTEMQIESKRTADGRVLVSEKDYDATIMSLVSKGFPKTTLVYDIYDKLGISSTDAERWQYLVFQLNDRIADTIKKIDGIKNATVTLNIPKKEGYLITDGKDTGSASVMIEMDYNQQLTAKQVRTIKQLVALSVPDILPENVVVADALTGVAMDTGEYDPEMGVNLQKLGFETQVEQKMADKVMNLLSLAYGRDNIRVSATVNLDYDKMITEQQQYIPEQEGGNVTNHKKEQYTMDGQQFAAGIAGEEDNTDLPIYVDEDGDGTPEYIDYSQSVDYLVSYIKTRIQKDTAIIKDASLAVALKVPELSEPSRDAIIDSVSKATGISKDKISVNNFNVPVTETPTGNSFFGSVPMGLILGIGLSSLILILVIILLVTRILKKNKEKQQAAMEAEIEENSKVQELELKNLEAQKLREVAQEEKRQEDVIIEEVQEFADENPQIVAALVRNWLRGDD